MQEEMGFEEQFEKREGRNGDAIAQLAAVVSVGIFLVTTWVMTLANSPLSFGWFAWHPLLQSTAVSLFSYGILTLQPTSQPKTKAAGLARHQLAMIVLGFPMLFLGTLSVVFNKYVKERPHFTTWHGTFGLITVGLLVLQVTLGGGSVWFDGRLFGGGLRAKLVWKYHRLVGYVAFAMLLFTAYLGGAWSKFASEHSPSAVRLLAYTFAPAILLVAISSRIRPSKLKFL